MSKTQREPRFNASTMFIKKAKDFGNMEISRNFKLILNKFTVEMICAKLLDITVPDDTSLVQTERI